MRWLSSATKVDRQPTFNLASPLQSKVMADHCWTCGYGWQKPCGALLMGCTYMRLRQCMNDLKKKNALDDYAAGHDGRIHGQNTKHRAACNLHFIVLTSLAGASTFKAVPALSWLNLHLCRQDEVMLALPVVAGPRLRYHRNSAFGFIEALSPMWAALCDT